MFSFSLLVECFLDRPGAGYSPTRKAINFYPLSLYFNFKILNFVLLLAETPDDPDYE